MFLTPSDATRRRSPRTSSHPSIFSARASFAALPRRTQAVLAVCVTLTLALALLVVPGHTAQAAASTPKAAAACGTTDIALNQPTTASSVESGQFPASAATDGSTQTRWSSAWSDPQWLEVDLGSDAVDLRRVPELGGRVRDGVPDTDLE